MAGAPRRRAEGLLSAITSALLAAGVVAVLWPAVLGGRATFVMVSGTSMLPRLHTGDLVVVRRERSYQTGEVVAYRVPPGEVGARSVVIHRVVGRRGATLAMRGDNKPADDPWHPRATDVLGRRILLVPRAGPMVAWASQPGRLAALAGIVATVLGLTWRPRRDPVPVAAGAPPRTGSRRRARS